MSLTPSENRKYLLPEKRDFEILGKCKELEKMKLSKTDREKVKLIRTQLERDWRKYLLVELNKLLKKYKNLL
ncbi:MAG: hypothetical protein A2Y82_01980 [Candidatus Buchananbacteria bacterium RBG_13_36_9]|uniref:Uncharacterized protein n=1 Tax=Candidatus Buchananbacteria bacterium RBG_13_36_9 TaxID=1797530 RepID=A0A1G1XMI9_9BACT|nr:MAG: hypothetical protein A2Y82_01980 [Candidatus Buchananbacteria bacterium RBG_13_36_9]